MNGLFAAMPAISGGPGLSRTFTLVPLGPRFMVRTSLNCLARIEFAVVGTVTVVVAPSALNQLDLSSLIFSLLASLDLYSGLPRCSRFQLFISTLPRILFATISLWFWPKPAHFIWTISLLICFTFCSQGREWLQFLILLDPS